MGARTLIDVFPFGPDERLLSVVPLSHMFGMTCDLLAPLAAGKTVVYPVSRQPAVLVRTFREFRVTMLLIVPQGLRLLSNAVERKVDASGKRPQFERLHALAPRLPRFARRLLFRPVLSQFGGRLRTFAVGASALEPELAHRWSHMGIDCLQGYGATEMSGLAVVDEGDARLLAQALECLAHVLHHERRRRGPVLDVVHRLARVESGRRAPVGGDMEERVGDRKVGDLVGGEATHAEGVDVAYRRAGGEGGRGGVDGQRVDAGVRVAATATRVSELPLHTGEVNLSERGYLVKGKQIYIDGNFEAREWTGQDGATRTSLDVTAREMQLLGQRGDDAGGDGGHDARVAPRLAGAGVREVELHDGAVEGEVLIGEAA